MCHMSTCIHRSWEIKNRQVKFHIDENIVPVAQQPQRIRFYLHDQLQKELNIIKNVEGQHLWYRLLSKRKNRNQQTR